MQQPLNLAWIEIGAHFELKREASRTLPLETGGCVMGYWAKEYTEVIITHIIGPGPRAIHGRWYFFPDTSWQAEEIAKVYSETDRLITYLGDWHSHPTNNSSLSFIDRWTIMRIGQYKPARVRAPLMGVMHSPQEWTLTLYCRRNKSKRSLLTSGELVLFNIKQYEKAKGDAY